jgi:hypothetical protein
MKLELETAIRKLFDRLGIEQETLSIPIGSDGAIVQDTNITQGQIETVVDSRSKWFHPNAIVDDFCFGGSLFVFVRKSHTMKPLEVPAA